MKRVVLQEWVIVSSVIILLLISTSGLGAVIYVDAAATGTNDGSSWADAYVELQLALAAVEYGDPIWVAAGTYKPDYDPDSGNHTGDREATFQLIDGVAIYGGFPSGGGTWEDRDPKALSTILSGDLSGDDSGDPDDPSKDDNSYHVVTGSGTTATTILDGVTITAGKEGTSEWYRWGAGMFIDQGSPTLNHCTFTKNYGGEAGGLFNWNDSNPSITNCDFIENYANSGGGVYNRESSPTLTNCRFIGNTTINAGAGMRNGGNSNPVLTNCVFLGNSARIGGGAECYESYQQVSSPVFINCIFSGNRAFLKGGGLRITANRYSPYGRPKLINCTLSGNTAGTDISSGQGGGIMASGKTHVEIINSIVWGNQADVGSAVYVDGSIDETRMTFSHSDYGGEFYIGSNANVSWVGTILQENPFFIDADGGDNIPGTPDDNLRLLGGSGCINQGTNTTNPPLPATDLAGKDRIQDSTVDMGAYEGAYQGVILSAESLVVNEAGIETFTVRLAMEPANPIEVNVSRGTGDSDITVESGGTLYFNSANYADPQTVIIATAADGDYLHGKAEIWVSHPDIFTGVVQVTEQDDDTPPVIYVDDDAPAGGDGTSWSNAFGDLQNALYIARVVPEVEEIRVGQGTYRPAGAGGDRSETFLLTDFENLSIQGGYVGCGAAEPNSRDIQACTTILSGDLDHNDGLGFTHNEENSYHVLKGIDIDNSVILDGFTITGGNANSDYWQNSCGGGLNNENSSLNISNCIFVRNHAESRGGGIYNQYSHKNVPAYTNCIFRGNSAYNGGGIYNRHSPILINCLFYGNMAHEDGGAIFNNEAFPALLQCTLSGNYAGNQGGGMVDFDGAQSTLTNCILWGNADKNGMTESSQFCQVWGGDPMINYCCIQEWSGVLDPEGVGNIDSDPCFVQPMYLAPISYWKFDEGDGTTAYDSTGSHHGTIYGDAEWVPGKVGGALRFDGWDDYVRVEHDPALNITGDLTISAWVYITRGREYQAIVTKCVGRGGWNNPYDFRTNSEPEPQLAFVRADAVAHERVYSKVKMPLGQWHHVLVRVENNVPDFYVNGILTGKYADTIFTRTPTGNTNPLLVGRRDDGLSFNGIIDEVMIFNRALLMEEIQALYHNDFNLLGDYQLRPDSPCIDAGDDAEVYTDLEGNLRPFDYPGVDNNGALPEFDMGAYEFVAVEAQMKVTPRTLNCRSHGIWIKAHLVLPEGFDGSDVDVDSPAQMEPLGITSENLKVSTGGDGLGKIEARFKRSEFCAAIGSDWPEEIVVFGSFTSGESFYGTADIRIILPGLKEIAELSSHWLQTGCKKPHWCGGMDMNQDSVVNLRDFALLQNQTMEIITK